MTSFETMEGFYPKFPQATNLQLDADDMECWIDLSPYLCVIKMMITKRIYYTISSHLEEYKLKIMRNFSLDVFVLTVCIYVNYKDAPSLTLYRSMPHYKGPFDCFARWDCDIYAL